MVETGKQEILPLISLFQTAMDTVSTIGLKGKKKQFGGYQGRWDSKEKTASGVFSFPIQQTPQGDMQWQAEGLRGEMLGDLMSLQISPEQTLQAMRTTSARYKGQSVRALLVIKIREKNCVCVDGTGLSSDWFQLVAVFKVKGV